MDALLPARQDRFAAHMRRHAGLAWSAVLARLQADPAALVVIGVQSCHAARGWRGLLRV